MARRSATSPTCPPSGASSPIGERASRRSPRARATRACSRAGGSTRCGAARDARVSPRSLSLCSAARALARAQGGGHAVIYVVERDDGGDSATLRFTVCNTGQGNLHHPSAADASSSKVKWATAWTLRVRAARLCSAAALGYLVKLRGVVAHENVADFFYGVLVPHLCDGAPPPPAREASARGPSALGDDDAGGGHACEFATPQRAGVCYCKAAVCCLKYLLRRAHVPRPERKRVMLALRWSLAARCAAELGAAPTAPLERSDARLAELGFEQTALAAVKAARATRLPADVARAIDATLADDAARAPGLDCRAFLEAAALAPDAAAPPLGRAEDPGGARPAPAVAPLVGSAPPGLSVDVAMVTDAPAPAPAPVLPAPEPGAPAFELLDGSDDEEGGVF